MAWKKPYPNYVNLPSETTPVTSTTKDNEDNIDILNSSFILASISANSDYILDISSYYEATLGSKISIDFPTAIDDTQNARISIDNGSTFINIFQDGSQILGSAVEETQQTLYYDGTQFNVIGVSQSQLSNLLVRAIVTATDTEFYDSSGSLIHTVAGANPTSITFDDVVQSGLIDIVRDSNKYQIFINGQMNNEILLEINTDATTTNYRYNSILNQASVATVAQGNINRLTSSFTDALSQVRIDMIMNLLNDNGTKYMNCQNKFMIGATGAGLLTDTGINGMEYNIAITNITSLNFLCPVNNFVNGSVIEIHKVV